MRLCMLNGKQSFQPKFLTREERAALALQRRAEQVERMREHQRRVEENRKHFEAEAKRAGEDSVVTRICLCP